MSIRTGRDAVADLERRTDLGHAQIMAMVRVIGGAMIGIAVLVMVLTRFFELEAMNVSSGPFASVMESLTTTGSAALGLLVIGLLVGAASQVMAFFGGGF